MSDAIGIAILLAVIAVMYWRNVFTEDSIDRNREEFIKDRKEGKR